MKPPVCCRKIGFDAGHRVVNHESKCAHLHGHRYTAEIYARSYQLDGVGRVIDFSVIKDLIGGWIDDKWDHGLVLWEKDPFCMVFRDLAIKGTEYSTARIMQKMYCIPDNPTAENMAGYLLNTICPSLLKDTAIEVFKIRLWETPNCFAEAEL